jgi:hypothetical protein
MPVWQGGDISGRVNDLQSRKKYGLFGQFIGFVDENVLARCLHPSIP